MKEALKILRHIQELLAHNSSKTAEVYTHVSKKGIDKIRNSVDDFFIEEIKMIKEKYKQLRLAHLFAGINTIGFTQSLGDIFLKNLFIEMFLVGFKNKEFDFFNFKKKGGKWCFLLPVPKTNFN